MTNMYQHLKSEKGKEIIKVGQRAASTTDILKDNQEGNMNQFDLKFVFFSVLNLNVFQ